MSDIVQCNNRFALAAEVHMWILHEGLGSAEAAGLVEIRDVIVRIVTPPQAPSFLMQHFFSAFRVSDLHPAASGWFCRAVSQPSLHGQSSARAA